MDPVWLVVALAIAIFVAVLPVHFAAGLVNTNRQGFGWCFVGLAAASAFYVAGLQLPVGPFGPLVAFVMAAVAFAWVLGTGIVGGIVIAIVHAVLSALILAALSFFFGVTISLPTL